MHTETIESLSVAVSGLLMLLGMLFFLLLKYFPNECAEWLRQMSSPSSGAVKSRSEKMLAQMNRNIAEKNALRKVRNDA